MGGGERPVSGTGTVYAARAVIVSTGATTKWLGVPNEQRLIGKGVHTCAQCDGFAYAGKRVVVVGGGDAAMEETMTLAKIAASVTVLVRSEALRASEIMAERVRANQKGTFTWDTGGEDVLGPDRVTGVRVKDLRTGAVSELPTDALFVAIGHAPATQFLSGQLALNAEGRIVAHDRASTSGAGVFAAGDVEDRRYRQAVTAAAGGGMGAMDAERWLAGQRAQSSERASSGSAI